MKRILSLTAAAIAAFLTIAPASAQNSYPAPGSGGGNSAPAPGSGGSFHPNPPNGIGWNPGPGGWGNPWTQNGPMIVDTPLSTPSWQNQGTANVVACGYDAQGIWRTLPLTVSYYYSGGQYNVSVINAWNPWTKGWDYDIDMPAYNTYYYLNGQYFDFYTPLSTGTYYFNL